MGQPGQFGSAAFPHRHFDLLQRRIVNSPARAVGLSTQNPATFMVFDVLAAEGVQPMIVAEVLADSARHAGALWHPVRFVRHRPDLSVEDLAERE